MRQLLFAACAMGAAVTAHAQPRGVIRGSVTDAATGAPLTGAVVRIVEAHRDEMTHREGRFVFDRLPPGTWTVLIRAIGYRPRSERVTLGGDTVVLRVALEATVIELAPTIVTGTISERSSDDALSPTTVVGGADLDRRLAPTVGASLADVPGVAVSSLGPATARPVIRGLGGDRILILEDGQRPGDLSSTNADHAVAIDPVAVRQFEVVRGPMGLLYGSSALGGVVNVIRDEIPEALPDHAHGELAVHGMVGTPGFTGGGWVTAPLGRLALRAEGSARRAADVRTPGGLIPGTDATTWSAGLGAALIGTSAHAGAAWRFYDSDYGVPGGFTGGHATDVGIRMRRHSVRATAESHARWAGFDSWRATAGYTDYHHEEFEPSGSVGTRFDQRTASLDVLARHGRPGGRQGAAGARAQFRDVATGGTLRTPPTYDWNLALFAVQESGRGAWQVQAGLRADVARYVPRDTTAFVTAGGQRIPVRPRTFGSFSGSLGLLWRATEPLRLGASVSRAYRTPDFNELYSNGPHLAANSFDVGDPSLRQETGHGVEVFARWTGRRIRAEAAAYVNQLTDYVFPSSRGRAELGAQGGRPRFQYSNADARLTGAEGDLELRLAAPLVLELTASAVTARFLSPRDSIPVITATDTAFVPASRLPPLIPPPHGRVALRFERPRGFAALGLRWSAAQHRLGDFETRTAAWATVDLSLGVRLLLARRFHALTLRVDNLADAAYRDHLDRLKDVQLQPGRSLALLYRLSF